MDFDLAGKKCLVLGASGFIGTNLCKALVKQGANVVGYARSVKADINFPCYQGEFIELESIYNAQYIFHLIGATTPANAQEDMIFDTVQNIVPTINMLDLARESDVKKVVFVSSGGTVYGPDASTPTHEGVETNPVSAYGITKLAIEKYLHMYDKLYGLDYTVLRVSNPYGPYQSTHKGQGVIGMFMQKLKRDEEIVIFGDGKSTRDYIYIDDVVSALILACQDDLERKVYNIGRGIGLDLVRLLEELEDVTGIKPTTRYEEPRGLDVPKSVLDISRAIRHLGWRPNVPLEVGLKRTWEWIKTQPDVVEEEPEEANENEEEELVAEHIDMDL